jgi:type VI secretion system protein ImpH
MPRDLVRALAEKGPSYNFFQASRLLERLAEESPTDINIRYTTDNSYKFPPSDIAAIEYSRETGIKMILTFMGIYGASSPLPTFFTDPIIYEKESYVPFRKFLDIFGNRIYRLYYLAWKKSRHFVRFRQGKEDGLTRGMYCLTGQGFHTSREPEKREEELRKIFFTGLYQHRIRSAANLEKLLSSYFSFKNVKIRQFTVKWVPNPMKVILGGNCNGLGKGAYLGETIQDRAGSFSIEIGPVSFNSYRDFFPLVNQDKQSVKPPLGMQLFDLVKGYLRNPLEFTVEVTLKTEGEKPPLLGSSRTHLGIGTWLGEKPLDPVKVVLSE